MNPACKLICTFVQSEVKQKCTKATLAIGPFAVQRSGDRESETDESNFSNIFVFIFFWRKVVKNESEMYEYNFSNKVDLHLLSKKGC